MKDKSWLIRWFEELSGRKVLRAAAAYAVAAWLLVEVATTVLPLFGAGDAVLRVIVIALVIGFPIAMTVSWGYDISRQGIRRTRTVQRASGRARGIDLVIFGALILLGAFVAYDRLSRPVDPGPAAPAAVTGKAPPSIAVLPFDNFSNDPANEVFGNGLAEELLNRLANHDELRVAARTSAFKFRGSDKDIREIGAALNVTTVLEGSVNASGDTIRVTAQLVDVATGFHIWSDRYDRQMTDVFAIQDEIATAVARSLELELLGDGRAPPVEEPTRDLDAYRLYLRGREEWHKRTSASLDAAVELFEQAIDLDPDFALAWSGLADSYTLLADYGNLPRAESSTRARRAATRALQIAPDLAEAHASMGLILHNDFRFADAAQSFTRAIELKPNFAMAHMWYGSVLMWIDEEGGIVERRKAVELDPLSPIANQLLGAALQKTGDIDGARAQFMRIVDFAPEYPLVYFQLAQLAKIDYDYVQALAYLHTANELDSGRASTLIEIANAYLELGDIDTATEWVDRAVALGPDQQEVRHARLTLMVVAADWDGLERFVAEKFVTEADAFSAAAYRSIVAYAREQYTESARLMDGIFAGIAARQGDSTEKYMVADQSQNGLVYLASALSLSGDVAKAREIAGRVLDHVQGQRERGVIDSDNRLVEIGAEIVMDNIAGALARVAHLAETGFTDYLRLDNDPLFRRLRNELEYQLSIDTIRRNAAEQLRQIESLEG